MNSEMNSDRDMLHKFLDGDLTAAEREAYMQRLKDDPAFRKEHDALASTLRMVSRSPRRTVPPAFTQDVMKRLPHPPVPLIVRLRDFLLRGRVLRWNMATALAAALVVMITVATVSRQERVPGDAVQIHSAAQEAAATVRLNFYAPDAKRVSVAGDFNKWQVDSHVMDRQAGGVWTVEITLKPGVYNYMFVVDDKAWITDPDAESYQDDGFGSKNAVMRVKT
jgi:anti-sigma-K factor RskA